MGSQSFLLPNVRHLRGLKYRLLLFTEKVCLYEQKNSNDLTIGYEVFRIKNRPERYFGDHLIPESIHFPSDENFGKWAWSIGVFTGEDREDARDKAFSQAINKFITLMRSQR